MESNLIRLSKSCIGRSEKEAVKNVLDREYLGMGEDVKEFERLLHEFFGRPVVCVSSGTAALHLALQASGLTRGDQVLVPSICWPTSLWPIIQSGLKPIFVDIDKKNFNIDLKDLKRKISKKTKALMLIHVLGNSTNMDELKKILNKNKIGY